MVWESNPGWVKFSASVQTDAEAHPASYTMGNCESSGRVVVLNDYLSNSYFSAPPLGCHGQFKGELHVVKMNLP
jgi:hypothetical protein